MRLTGVGSKVTSIEGSHEVAVPQGVLDGGHVVVADLVEHLFKMIVVVDWLLCLGSRRSLSDAHELLVVPAVFLLLTARAAPVPTVPAARTVVALAVDLGLLFVFGPIPDEVGLDSLLPGGEGGGDVEKCTRRPRVFTLQLVDERLGCCAAGEGVDDVSIAHIRQLISLT